MLAFACMTTASRRRSMTMKAWRLDRLGGELRFEDVPMPEVRPGSILVRIEASTLMSYIKPYVAGRLPSYHVPAGGFTPGDSRREDAWLSLRCVVRPRMFQTPRKSLSASPPPAPGARECKPIGRME